MMHRTGRITRSLLAATVSIATLAAAGIVLAAPASADVPPSAADDAYATDFGTTLFVPATTGLLANDDPGTGTELTVVWPDTSGLAGTAAVNADGSFDFTPWPGFTGTTSFTYNLSNGQIILVTPTRVTITVGDVRAVADAYRLGVGVTTLNVAAPGVLGNDTAATSVVAADVVRTTTHGSLTLGGDGAFSYSPTAGYTGTDAFTYTATSSSGGRSQPQTVQLTIDPPNSDLGVKVATSTATVTPGSTFTLTVIVYDNGPRVPTNVVVGVDVGRKLTVVSATGGTIAGDRHTVGYALRAVGKYKSVTFTLTLKVPAAGLTGKQTITGSVRSLDLPDFVAFNNSRQLTVKPVAA